MGKSDRAFWFSLICIILLAQHWLAFSAQLLFYLCSGLLALINLLLCLTVYNRIKNSLK